jgi:hypothetical protein
MLFFFPQSFYAPSFLLFFGCVLFRLVTVTSVFFKWPYTKLRFPVAFFIFVFLVSTFLILSILLQFWEQKVNEKYTIDQESTNFRQK